MSDTFPEFDPRSDFELFVALARMHADRAFDMHSGDGERAAALFGKTSGQERELALRLVHNGGEDSNWERMTFPKVSNALAWQFRYKSGLQSDSLSSLLTNEQKVELVARHLGHRALAALWTLDPHLLLPPRKGKGLDADWDGVTETACFWLHARAQTFCTDAIVKSGDDQALSAHNDLRRQFLSATSVEGWKEWVAFYRGEADGAVDRSGRVAALDVSRGLLYLAENGLTIKSSVHTLSPETAGSFVRWMGASYNYADLQNTFPALVDCGDLYEPIAATCGEAYRTYSFTENVNLSTVPVKRDLEGPILG